MGRGTRDGAGLSVRAMAAAAAALGQPIGKSQVQRDYHDGAPREVTAYLAWCLARKDVSRTAAGRIDRPQASAPSATNTPPAAVGGLASAAEGGGNTTPPPSSEDAAEPSADTADENTAAYRVDRARNERIKADRGDLELQQFRGELVPVRQVEQLQFTAARITRDRLQQVAPRIAADLQALAVSLLPEAQRDAFAAALPVHELEQRLDAALRDALNDAAKAIEDASREDDDPDSP